MSDAAPATRLPPRDRIALALAKPLVRLLASTWRYSLVNEAALLSLRDSKRAFIFSIWHGQLLPLIWHHRGQGVAILVSEHKDGEIIARFAHSIGYGTIRGSTTRGATGALRALVRALKEGQEIGITPDGPKGPAYKFSSGAATAASMAGALILPMVAHTGSAWRLRSWDRFMIPKPFARIVIAYGNPLEVASDPRAAARQTELLEDAMTGTVGIAVTASNANIQAVS